MNMTIAKRLMIMIAVTLVSLVLVGGAGFFSIAGLRSSLDHANKVTLPSVGLVDALEVDLLQTRVNVQLHVMATNDETMRKAEAAIKTQREEMAKEIKHYEPLTVDARDKELFEKARQAVEAYLGKIDMVLDLSRSNHDEEARNLILREVGPLGDAAYEALEEVAGYNEKEAKQDAEAAETSATRSLVVVSVAILLAIAAIGGIGVPLIRGINGSLRLMRDTVAQIEQSLDFTRRAEVKQQDEIGQTAGALNRLIEHMQGNLKEIASGIREVAKASEQLSDTSDQVAQAANQQSSAASSMAATVEEMTVSINHVGDRAGEANAVSEESGRLAASGEKIISQTVADINEIARAVEAAADQIRQLEAQSQGISSVVAVIKEVADQTNLLALNAAIEAARAGEQGRGFAVVADEVRKLAERTSASTQEIAAMVDSIRAGAKSAVDGMGGAVDRVSVGVEHARDASDAIQKIGAGSRDAVNMVSEITTSIREQSSASNNIAQQVERIASMSEESSAAAQESAESARNLDQLAIRMQQIVGVYRL